jgi:hypothetical protein
MPKKVSKGQKATRKEGEEEYARQLLRAHFAEDRNEFLNGEDIRVIGGEKPPATRATNPSNRLTQTGEGQ